MTNFESRIRTELTNRLDDVINKTSNLKLMDNSKSNEQKIKCMNKTLGIYKSAIEITCLMNVCKKYFASGVKQKEIGKYSNRVNNLIDVYTEELKKVVSYYIKHSSNKKSR